MSEDLASPAEIAIRAHLASARFQSGVDENRWRLITLEWPSALIGVSAAPREASPSEYVLKFDLSGYPIPGLTAALWDESGNCLLDERRRPKGNRASRVFRADWEGGRALYAPWDYVALGKHEQWPRQHQLQAWHVNRDLTFYLVNTWEVLNDDAYLGS